MTALDLSPATARRLLGPFAPAEGDDAVVDRLATVVWCHLLEPGDSVAGQLLAGLGPSESLRLAVGDSTTALLGETELATARKRWLPRLSLTHVGDALHSAARAGVQLVTRSDPEWPEQVDDLGLHAPVCLWVRGAAVRLSELRPSVAVVGARAATSYGEHVAIELAAELAGSGIAVVSGGAYGIDAAAHRATLSVGGLTVALLAGGVDRAYPAGNAGLIDRIAASGAVVSEVPCGSAPTKWRFLQRNRLIAALAGATVVVEAGWRSGSLNTAGHAAALSRPLGAVPGPITSAASAGTHRLLREYGAQCITSAADIREMIGFDGTAPFGAMPYEGDRTDDTTRVRDALSVRAWRETADVARRAGMAPDEVEAILGLLDLEGSVARGPGGWRKAGSRE
ncbi:DNA-processing protein DprA [Microbacterium sp. CFH 31415]|uniref:DNA-processing protein DprA n=1 Tax=Microbacterium sp. CFH 31415 TaxID=2921732 RepID=UPI001F138104|nr:DNA-processing protein DprA [Microbacterium sp. CFH 31415]MCH6229348.1 DNA-processing protein DprA [Microbacterium sp. CFH 31415]